MKKCLTIILCISLLHSCNRKYTSNPEILHAEKILNTFPDSSFVILSGIEHPEKMKDADYAAWCLNYTHALYKLHKEIKSDSIISISIRYYNQSYQKKYAGTSYYLLGNIYRLNKKNKDAMVAFKKAEILLSSTHEDRILGLVEYYMGLICMSDELYNHSLNYYRKSLEYSKKAGDKKTSAYTFRLISDTYNQLGYPKDTILYYSKLALKLSGQESDSINYYSILARQGELLYNSDYYLSKEYILNGYRHLHTNFPYYASFLAYVYMKLNKPDSAQYYLKISLADTSKTTNRITNYQVGALIAKNAGEYQKAYYLIEKAYVKRDSVYQKNISDQLYRIDKQYDLSEREKDNLELTIANQRKIIWISVLGVVVLLMALIILQILNWYRKNKFEQDKKLQAVEFENEASKRKNDQKREIIRLTLNNKIENTLRLNRLKKGMLQRDTKDAFLNEITFQSILTENVWKDYIDNVNKLVDNGITLLKEEYSDLSQLDQMVIALICLNVKLQDSCSLLSMEKQTMYKRRKTIKKRLDLDAETDLEEWLQERMK